MHMWAPEAPESKEHLARLDDLFGQAMKAAPDAAFLATADHGMNAKSVCWDLEQVCARKRRSDPQSRFHGARPLHEASPRLQRGRLCSTSRVRRTQTRVREIIVSGVKGVERILTREEAAREFHLMASRIGDLVVLG